MAELMSDSQELSPRLREHLRDVAKRVMAPGSQTTFGKAFGIERAGRSGQHSWRRAASFATRRRYMDEAMELASAGDRDCSDNQKLVRLAAALRDFASLQWPQWRGLDAPPADASDLLKALFWARYHHRIADPGEKRFPASTSALRSATTARSLTTARSVTTPDLADWARAPLKRGL